jgi:DNA processing protein
MTGPVAAPGRGDADRASFIALAHCVEPGDAATGRLLQSIGPAELVDRIRAGRTGLRHGEGLAARLAAGGSSGADDRATRCDARIVTRADREWPTQLEALGEQAPLALWVRGAADLRLLALRSVSIVGARACTAYGEEVARMWAAELASDSWTVLSGAAFGIDAAAHRGALSAGGPTVAVLAGGVDVPYPRAHTALLARIAEEGAVVSESPPGESVRRQRFLTRNRVIAALGRATLVVEAADRSGTTATARAASAMNRPVLAVPGPVFSPASAGCHRMIREGLAMLVADVPDLLDMLDLTHGGRAGLTGARRGRATPPGSRDSLGVRERTVLDALPARGVLGLDALVRAAGLSHTDVLAGIGILTAEGWAEEDGGGWRLARSGGPVIV